MVKGRVIRATNAGIMENEAIVRAVMSATAMVVGLSWRLEMRGRERGGGGGGGGG